MTLATNLNLLAMTPDEKSKARKLRVRAQIASVDTFEAIQTMYWLRQMHHMAPMAFQTRDIRLALVSAAVVSYCRPFKSSKGKDAAPRLALEDLDLQLDRPLMDLHDEVITIRDQIVAHSDSDLLKLEQIPIDRRGPGQYSCKMESTSERIQAINWELFQKLLAKVNDGCARLAGALSDQLEAE